MIPYKYYKRRFKNDLDMTRYLNDIGLDTDSIIHISRTTYSDYPWTLIFVCSTPDDAMGINDLQARTSWDEYFKKAYRWCGMYIVESDFEYKGYRCVVTFGDMLYRCGYIGLPEGHHLYGKSFMNYLDIKKEDMAGVERDKRGIIPWLCGTLDEDDRIRMDVYFNVHGGLTYGGGGKGSEYPVKSDLWWFGFDCAHAGDAIDFEFAEKYWPDDANVKMRVAIHKKYFVSGEEVRTKEYCEEECRSLVDQIIGLVERPYNHNE